MTLAPQGIGQFATYGATMLLLGPRLPVERQRAAFEKGKGFYEQLYRAQEKGLDQYPVHFKGEVLSGMAEAEHWTGNPKQSRVWLQRILTSMPGTPYETQARKWLDKPESISKTNRVMCQTCHEPGRLGPRLAALEKAGQ